MSSDVVDVFINKATVPYSTQKLVNIFIKMIIDGSFHPFSGPLIDQDGKIRVAEGDVATNSQIFTMDWFVAGIEGNMPVIDKKYHDKYASSEMLELGNSK